MKGDSLGRAEGGEPLLKRIAGHEARLRAMGIDRLAVVGSRAMRTARPDSDVDLIVHFRDGEASYFVPMLPY